MSRGRILGLLLIIAVLTFIANRPQRLSSDTDARITFYKQRTAGPGSYPAYARLGMAYLQKARETGDPVFVVQAEQSLLKSMQFQQSFEALRALAFLYMEQHRFEEARSYAEKALESLPSDLESVGVLSDAYWALGDSEHAMALVRQMLVSSDNFAGLSRLGVIQFAEGDPPGALSSMRNACTQAERESRPLDNLAWCYTRVAVYATAACDNASAEAAYQKAFSYIPEYYGARREMERREDVRRTASCRETSGL